MYIYKVVVIALEARDSLGLQNKQAHTKRVDICCVCISG